MNKSIEDIYKELFATYEMDVRPKTKKVKEGTVIDEDKSVKWNREEVKRLNDAYVEETRSLRRKRNEKEAKVREELVKAVNAELEKNVSEETVKKMIASVDEQESGEGVTNHSIAMEDLIDLVNSVIKDVTE